MTDELNSIENSSRMSVIVTTANAELIKDLANTPFFLLLLLTPWRLVQWFKENFTFTYPNNVFLI
jgi:hypothetical protein